MGAEARRETSRRARRCIVNDPSSVSNLDYPGSIRHFFHPFTLSPAGPHPPRDSRAMLLADSGIQPRPKACLRLAHMLEASLSHDIYSSDTTHRSTQTRVGATLQSDLETLRLAKFSFHQMPLSLGIFYIVTGQPAPFLTGIARSGENWDSLGPRSRKCSIQGKVRSRWPRSSEFLK